MHSDMARTSTRQLASRTEYVVIRVAPDGASLRVVVTSNEDESDRVKQVSEALIGTRASECGVRSASPFHSHATKIVDHPMPTSSIVSRRRQD